MFLIVIHTITYSGWLCFVLMTFFVIEKLNLPIFILLVDEQHNLSIFVLFASNKFNWLIIILFVDKILSWMIFAVFCRCKMRFTDSTHLKNLRSINFSCIIGLFFIHFNAYIITFSFTVLFQFLITQIQFIVHFWTPAVLRILWTTYGDCNINQENFPIIWNIL